MIYAMRTIIELPEEQIAKLDALRAMEHLSRAELIRRAVDAYLQAHTAASLSDQPGFGAWKRTGEDGVALQRRLRAEWGE